jgi:hypothetical protein
MRYTLAIVAALASCDDGTVRLGNSNDLREYLPPDDAGPQVGKPSCAPPPADASGCPTFAADIYPLMQPSAWGCTATKCHGPNLITLQGDAGDVYDAMAKYPGGNGKRYVNPACSELDQSAFDCDVAGIATKPCWTGVRMPEIDPSLGNHAPTETEIKKLEDWIRCGAP